MGTLAGILGMITQVPKIVAVAELAVTAVEGLFGHGNGDKKKQAAVAMTSSALQGLAQIQLPGGAPLATPDFVTALQELIDAVVKLKNSLPAELGGFAHAAASPVAAK